MNDEQNPYDETPYASYPYPQSHPNRLATVATLFGMHPQSLQQCSVLELGCASGGNLIPLGVALPGSRFVGIDLSARQVEEGHKTIHQLGLNNVDLKRASILDVTSELGQFDYIICHGVWSWVSPEVRDKILAICREQLAPQGVAYVSYNTYPGWHMRGTIRDMMVYHTRKCTTPKECAHHARALLDFLVRSVPQSANVYSILLKNEMNRLRSMADSYLLHDYLEHVNEPVYFYQFAEQAAAKDLQFLGEADVGAMLSEGFAAEVEHVIKGFAETPVEREQYLDFLRNRLFRQTLLCHSGVALNWCPDYERMRSLFFASPLIAPKMSNLLSKEAAKFTGMAQGPLGTTDPALKTALHLLGRAWPEAIQLEALVSQVQSRMDPEPLIDSSRRQRDARLLARSLLNCYTEQFVTIYVEPPCCKAVPGEFPLASPLTRFQATQRNVVTNLNHQLVEVNDIARHILRLCDGTHNRDAMLTRLLELADHDAIVVHDNEGTVIDYNRRRSILAESLDRSLTHLTRHAVLVG